MEGSVAKSPTENTICSSEIAEAEYHSRAYIDERKLLVDRCHEAHRDLDKWTLTLSGGALGLSITGLGIVLGAGWQIDRQYVLFAWIFFVLSIITVVGSIWCSAKCYDKFRNIIDIAVAEDLSTWRAVAREKQENCKLASTIDRLNVAGIVFFAIGAIFLVCFASTIGPSTETINGERQEWEQRVETSTPGTSSGQTEGIGE